jgi:predicted outer membrane protein
MTAKAALHQAILAAFASQNSEDPAAPGALTDVLCAFADVVRGEPVAMATAELVADDATNQLLRDLIHEIRADRQERAQAMRQLALNTSPG